MCVCVCAYAYARACVCVCVCITPSSLKLTEANIRWIFCWMFSYTSNNGKGEVEVALRCCKTEHYYPSSPLPRTLRRPGSWVEEDAMAKTKNPGNYGQGPLTPTLPPFSPRRDLSPDSWFLTFIFRSNIASCFALFIISHPWHISIFLQILIFH